MLAKLYFNRERSIARSRLCTNSLSAIHGRCVCFVLHVDVPGETYRPAISADVVAKPCHYGKVAKATEALQPVLGVHFSEASEECARLHTSSNLNLEHLATTAEVQTSGGCGSDLSCARAESSATGEKKNRHGVLGAGCMHGLPVRGSFVDLLTPENFSYYLIMLFFVLYYANGRIGHVYWPLRMSIGHHVGSLPQREGPCLAQGPSRGLDSSSPHSQLAACRRSQHELSAAAQWPPHLHGWLANRGTVRAALGSPQGMFTQTLLRHAHRALSPPV
jgi:hypothetical protein